MSDNISLDALAEEIKQAEEHIRELKKQYNELKYANLNSAREALRDAEERVRQEYRDLGYGSLNIPGYKYYWRNLN
tara:strand:- start:1680 stop:1907 length:228 start_codon:yes stop_codon:yes gene_type:complete